MRTGRIRSKKGVRLSFNKKTKKKQYYSQIHLQQPLNRLIGNIGILAQGSSYFSQTMYFVVGVFYQLKGNKKLISLGLIIIFYSNSSYTEATKINKITMYST